MDTIQYTHLKEGKLYDLKCAWIIRNLLKNYNYMKLVVEKQKEQDDWKVFSVSNYMRMNFHKEDEMILYAYGEDREEEKGILIEICKRIRESSE